MLTASRRLDFGGTSLTMGVSQGLDQFHETVDRATTYFADSAGFMVCHERNELAHSERENKEVAENGIQRDDSEHQAVNRQAAKHTTTEDNSVGEKQECAVDQPCVRPKYGTQILGFPDKMAEDKDKRKEKTKRKWRPVGAEEMGFRLTLFPRVTVPKDEEEVAREADIFMAVMKEFDDVTEKSRPFLHLLQLEGSGVSREDKITRRDGDRRVRKAHVQIKTKNITSVLNNRGRKTLYIHFRLYKMFPFLHCSNHSHPNLPSPPKRSSVCMEVARAAVKAQCRAAAQSRSSCPRGRGDRRGAPPQDLAHTLHNDNAPSELPLDVISFLINLQHREMTPEDYDMLLRLDEGVAPKTISSNVLQMFKTDIVGPDSVGGDCSVCMEQYEVGQNRKFLPCGHMFHTQCIEMWLNNSSQNCPLDGMPVDPS